MVVKERQLQAAQTAAAMARVAALQEELMMAANDATSTPPSESLIADVAVQQSTSSMQSAPTQVSEDPLEAAFEEHVADLDQALEDEDQALEDPADEPPTAGDPQATQSYLIETVEGAADSSNSPTAHLAAAALTPLPSDSDEEEDGVHDPLDTAFEAQHDPPDAAFEAQHDALTAADADSGAGGEDSKYNIDAGAPMTDEEALLIFELFDADGNGTIDIDELAVFVKAIKHRDTVSREQVSEVWDKDQNGQVDLEEFTARLHQIAKAKSAWLPQIRAVVATAVKQAAAAVIQPGVSGAEGVTVAVKTTAKEDGPYVHFQLPDDDVTTDYETLDRELQQKIEADGYTLVPTVNEIRQMSTEQRRALPHLTLSRSGAGSVRWESSLDLEGPQLAQIIENVQLEPCGLTVVSRELLGCACLVTLKSVKGGTGTPAEQQETMKRKVEMRGEQFVSFDPFNKTVQFRISPVGIPSEPASSAAMSAYVTSPSAAVLQQMDAQQLSAIQNFSVTRSGVGTILWRDRVDLRQVSVQQQVQIECGRVCATGNLNRPCTVLLENIRPSKGKTSTAAEKKSFLESLREQAQATGGKFVRYEESSSEFALSFERFEEKTMSTSGTAAAEASIFSTEEDSQVVRCTGGHECIPSEYNKGAYINGWVCSDCGKGGKHERWFCEACFDDYCYNCRPQQEQAVDIPSDDLSTLTKEELCERLHMSQQQVQQFKTENTLLKSNLSTTSTTASGDAMQEFFVMTVVAANMRRPFESRVNSDNDELYKEVQEHGVPMWDWAEWIERRLWFATEWADWLDAKTGPDHVLTPPTQDARAKARMCSK